jgi:signal transduction histidine kinase
MVVKSLTNAITYLPKKLSLRTVLIVPFVLQILGTVGLVGYFSFRNGQQAVNDLASQLRSELTSRIEEKLRNYTEIPHAINYFNANAFAKGDIDIVNAKGEDRFWQQIEIFPSTSLIYCGSQQNGEIFGVGRLEGADSLLVWISNASTGYIPQFYSLNAQGNRDRLQGKENKKYDARLRPWYKAAVTKNRPTWSVIYPDFTTSLPTITASMPVYDSSDGSLLGVCATDFFLPQEMNQFLRSLKIGKTGSAFIMERSGLLVSASTDEPIKTGSNEKGQRFNATESNNPTVRATAEYLRDREENLQQLNTTQQFDFYLNSKRQFVQVLPFKDKYGLDWLIVIVVPESDFMERINANTRLTLLLCLAALMGATVLGILIVRWIAQPVLSLSQSAKALAKGEWEPTVNIDRADELGELATSFNSMASQLKASFDEMKTLNEILSQSESQLKQFLDAMPVGVTVHDVTGQLYYASQKAKELLGIKALPNITSLEQLSAVYRIYRAGTTQLYPSEQLPLVRSLHGESAQADDLELHRLNGAIVPLEAFSTTIVNSNGEIIYAIVAFADISQRKRAEKVLANYNRILERQVSDRTQKLSQALEDLKATQSELIQSEKLAALGQLIAGIAHEINSPLGAINSCASHVARHFSQTLLEFPILLVSLSPQQKQSFMSLMSRSLQSQSTFSTREKRQFKESLIQQLAAAEIKNARSVADTLVDMGIYNDINDFLPLFAREDGSYLLDIAYKLSGVQRSIQTINLATERASRVVFALKAYAHFDRTNRIIPSNLIEGIENVLILYQNQLKHGVEVKRNYAEIPSVWCYPDELHQVWTNLLQNALQAMDNRGTLTIDVMHREERVQVSIIDTGKGIPQEIQPRVFEPFFTTKSLGEGSGLGLYIVKTIIEKHGGEISVESQSSRTTFDVFLPIDPRIFS